MLIRLDRSTSLYQQVYESLRDQILAATLPAGGKLPSTRALAADLHVSRNTVLLAYEQLLAEGYIQGSAGSGTYVSDVLPDEGFHPKRPRLTGGAAPRFSEYGKRIGIPPRNPEQIGLRYDFRYGLPAVEDFPHQIWRRMLMERANAVSLRSLRYGPPEGYEPLRKGLASYLRRARGVVCEDDQVLIVNGSQQALDLSARLLLNPKDVVVLEEPNYPGARRIFQAAGARLKTVLVDDNGFQVDRLPRAAALAYVTPSHQFPSGAVLSAARRLALLSWAERSNAYVLEDDYDSEYRYEQRPIPAVQGLDTAGRVIYIGTFSKSLFPALRIGFMVLPPSLLNTFVGAKWLNDRQTPTMEQEVLARFIDEGHFERHLRRSRTRYALRRAALLDSLQRHLGTRVEISGENAGIHVLVWLNDVAASHLQSKLDRAAEAGVGVYSVAPYFMKAPARAGLLFGYASLTETAIREGIRILAKIL